MLEILLGFLSTAAIMTSLFAGVSTDSGLPLLTRAADITLRCSSVQYNLSFRVTIVPGNICLLYLVKKKILGDVKLNN